MIQTFYRRCLITLALLLCSATTLAQTCALPGWNGPATITGGVNFINAYYGGSGSPAAGASTINIVSATAARSNNHALVAGDMILIMQMQDSTNGANAGKHEYAQVASITGTAITLTRPLTNAYAQVMNATNVRNWQVIWVPQYSALTVTGSVKADTWTIVPGTGVATGGVIAMDVAGSMTLNGTVTAAGQGFRGAYAFNGSGNIAAGAPTTDNVAYSTTTVAASINGGQKGEGSMGTPPRVFAGTVLPVTYTALLNQGYTLGAGGQASIGNAGGGSNDGEPTASGNSYNSGGGGGGNAGAGGRGGNSWNDGTNTNAALNQGTNTNIGNVAGGEGGNVQANDANRLVMGGGGGAGAANNATVANGLTAWPPTNTITTGNGATGPITSSGASGGGVVLIRAGSISGTGRIDVSGYRAYNKFPLGETDSGGGGGAGGSAYVVATSGNGAGITINASGGNGGYSNYFQHGPGGGGGGGQIITSLTGATTNVTGGPNGMDACCGVTGAGAGAGTGSPKAWNAQSGADGVVTNTTGTPSGLGGGGGTCLPNIAVTKSTSTPNVTATTGAQARYSINLTNSGGGASNIFVFDASLPKTWSYTAAVAPTYQYDPSPTGGAPILNAGFAGAHTAVPALPGAFPVNTFIAANSITTVSLRAAATAPGDVPATGDNTPTFGSFYLPSEGSLTINFTVNISNTSTVGTYHNPAGVSFLDPTRTTTAVRMVSPATNVNANRGGVSYSQTTYASGGTTNVGGSNYSGLEGGPTTEDVNLLPDLTAVKTLSTTTFTLGIPGSRYVVSVRNVGRTITHQIYNNTQATSQSATVIVGSPVLTDTMPPGMSVTAVVASDVNWTCSTGPGSASFTCSASNADFPWNTNTSLASVTASITVSFPACPGPQVNTANVTTTTLGDVTPANNAASVSTPVGCSTNLTVTKTNAFTTVMAGGTTAYTITVANLGPATGDGTTVLDDPSDGLACTVASCTAAGAGVCPGAGVLPDLIDTGITLSSFAPGSTLTFALSCTVTATGSN